MRAFFYTATIVAVQQIFPRCLGEAIVSDARVRDKVPRTSGCPDIVLVCTRLELRQTVIREYDRPFNVLFGVAESLAF